MRGVSIVNSVIYIPSDVRQLVWRGRVLDTAKSVLEIATKVLALTASMRGPKKKLMANFIEPIYSEGEALAKEYFEIMSDLRGRISRLKTLDELDEISDVLKANRVKFNFRRAKHFGFSTLKALKIREYTAHRGILGFEQSQWEDILETVEQMIRAFTLLYLSSLEKAFGEDPDYGSRGSRFSGLLGHAHYVVQRHVSMPKYDPAQGGNESGMIESVKAEILDSLDRVIDDMQFHWRHASENYAMLRAQCE